MAEDSKEMEMLDKQLDELSFQCQKLEIMNFNLENQLELLNRQLRDNIQLLEQTEREKEKLLVELNSLREKSLRYNGVNKRIGEIISNAHDYAMGLVGENENPGDEEQPYVAQMNALLGRISRELNKASQTIVNSNGN